MHSSESNPMELTVFLENLDILMGGAAKRISPAWGMIPGQCIYK